MLSARLCKGELPLQRSVCVFMNAACSQHRKLQQQMFANVQERFSVHLNEIICSELPPSTDCSDKKKAPTTPLLLLFLCLFSPSPPNKETNREPNKPNSSPVQPSTSRTVPGWGNHWNCLPPTRAPPPPKPPPRHAHTPPIFLPLSSPLSSLLPAPPPSSPLQNEMPVSDRLSQFADPCGTHPFRPGHCASRSLAKRRGIIFIPQTRGYAPMISNACRAHCQGWFWPCAKPIILISLSLYFNSHRQCRFTAEHIREIKISLRH